MINLNREFFFTILLTEPLIISITNINEENFDFLKLIMFLKLKIYRKFKIKLK